MIRIMSANELDLIYLKFAFSSAMTKITEARYSKKATLPESAKVIYYYSYSFLILMFR